MAKCEIVVRGNLGKDVEAKFSKAGKPYSVLSVGSTPSRKGVDGEFVDGETMWFSVVVFSELNPFEFKKGARVEVEGVFTHRSFTRKDGSLGFALEVAASDAKVVYAEKPEPKQFEQSVIPASWQPAEDDLPF